MLWWLTQNTLSIAVLALVIALVCRVGRLRPALCHALWLVVLLKFITPPIVHWPLPAAEMFADLQLPRAFAATALQTDDTPLSQPAINTVTQFPQASTFDGLSEHDAPQTDDAAPLAFVDPQLKHSELLSAHAQDALDLPDDSQASHPIAPTTTRQVSASPTHEIIESARSSGFITFVLLGVWLSGATVFAIRYLRQIVAWRRRMKLAEPAPASLQHVVKGIAATLAVQAPQTLLVKNLASPMIWCLGRPKLLWPQSHGDHQARRGFRGVIAHELAHLKRRDHWVAWLDLAVRLLWWWNPLYWMVRRQLNASREMACDAWVLALWPEEGRTYARSLLHFSRLASPAPLPALGASAGGRRAFERRLTMILSQPVSCRMSLRGLLAAMILAIVALPSWSADPPQDESKASESKRDESKPDDPQPPRVPSPPSPSLAPSDIDKLLQRVKQLEEELAKLRSHQATPKYPAAAPAVAPAPGTPQLPPPVEAKPVKPPKTAAPAAVAAPPKSAARTTPAPAPPTTPPIDPAADPTQPARTPANIPWAPRSGTTEARPSGLFGGQNPSGGGGVSAYLDLVNLATATADAAGNLKLAEQRLHRIKAIQEKANAISASEVASAEVEFETARRKVGLLTEIAKAALEAAVAEVEIAAKGFEAGQRTASDLRAAESKAAILKIIIKSGD